MIIPIIMMMLRKKWKLIRIFIMNPLISIVPLILLSSTILKDYDPKLIFNMCIYTCFTATTYQLVYDRMRFLSEEKIQDLLMSKTNIYKFNFFHTIATNLFYIPSFLITLFAYCIILNISFAVPLILISTGVLLINSILFSYLTLSIHLKTKNYFNTFNLFMDFMYVLSGVLYSITILPEVIQYFSKSLPITYALNYSDIKDYKIVVIVFILGILISLISLKRSVSKYIKNGGFYA